ncbi:hypothetical protein [Planomicrobium sp. YIM 101495]|uniref:hypothetical protein n=1 Tax=Planomicrobium sp. YIM 101495 TaxID=2665160 RepID=UPI0012B8EF69|nr:hypothetical protein [Planomicrobium sp. YIM 101495]MTD30113.1 hypothetical protein [Planomicrobium sp. YIM 101495]
MARENALFMEATCRKALNIEDRGGLDGLIDADTINSVGMGYYVLSATLSPYFKYGNKDQRILIDNFLSQYSTLSDNSIDYDEYNEILGEALTDLRKLLPLLD